MRTKLINIIFLLIKVNLKISSLIQNLSYFLLTLSRSNAACPEFSTSMFLKEAEMQKQLKYDFPITIKILFPNNKNYLNVHATPSNKMCER